MFSKGWSKSLFSVLACVFVLSLCIGLPGAFANDDDDDDDNGVADCQIGYCENDCKFTQNFRTEDCKFKATGVNPYFKLLPGYYLDLEGEDDGEDAKVVITVLKDTKWIDYNGGIITRVVEEREWVGDDLVEISRNFFAICDKTNDVFYFGELSLECEDGFNDDDLCEDGADDEGSWEVGGENEAKPGIIMPGSFLLGAKYFQEIAEEDDALDRGQNVKMGLTVNTDAGTFTDCVKVIDTSSAEQDEGDDDVCLRKNGDPKKYCPDVGLVQDEDLKLVKYGFVDCNGDDDDDDDHHHHDWRKKWGDWRNKWSHWRNK